MTAGERPPWWHNTRGEWYVLGQLALMTLVAVGPRVLWGMGALSFPLAVRVAGLALVAAGVAGFAASGRTLGASLTPFPRPRRRGRLVQSGPYAVVRHPIYTSVLAMALGWALWRASGWTFAYGGALLLLFDSKARREERWMLERFPDYASYQRRVPRLLPWPR